MWEKRRMETRERENNPDYFIIDGVKRTESGKNRI